jgi:hypothetical protein
MVLRSAISLLMLMLLASAALAEKWMALLIGNETYASEVGRLTNLHNDVALPRPAARRKCQSPEGNYCPPHQTAMPLFPLR